MTTPVAVTARGLWQSSHPGPTCVVTALALALGLAAGLEPWRLVLLTAAVFAGQLSVGISNDAIDVTRDRIVGRSDKPIARGVVSVRAAWVAAVGCLLVALLLSVPLGIGMLGVHAVTLASAWAYNAGAKATPFSLLPFLVSFGLFPSLATLSAAEPRFSAGWAVVAGAALGAAVHLTNVLPDLDDDGRTGIRGLPHRLGARASAVLAALGVAVGAVAVLLGPVGGDVAEVAPASWAFFVAVLGVAVLGAVAALQGAAGRMVFRLVMLSALLLAAQLVATGGALAA
ncbi:1,4-dihydroxy-2-naphthoate prenyltransferase [Microbacterium caowuchunii]|uniref:UbiA family prenyltransferase n=1 Tax=Microbacterium caowuchunii TaxID=2614638 RepID=UPI0012483B65|nr:UbiA family prenyltransferase [Microbacterium caowuchunii]QEW01191.1 1,4-dihydroxy-2-naphthoate prenyltransferase [Microbacterium caowuchunii]